MPKEGGKYICVYKFQATCILFYVKEGGNVMPVTNKINAQEKKTLGDGTATVASSSKKQQQQQQ
jgi:hypothetical protein